MKETEILRGLHKAKCYAKGTPFVKGKKGVDKVDAKLTHGEAVLPVKTVKAVGATNIARLIADTNGRGPKRVAKEGGKYKDGLAPLAPGVTPEALNSAVADRTTLQAANTRIPMAPGATPMTPMEQMERMSSPSRDVVPRQTNLVPLSQTPQAAATQVAERVVNPSTPPADFNSSGARTAQMLRNAENAKSAAYMPSAPAAAVIEDAVRPSIGQALRGAGQSSAETVVGGTKSVLSGANDVGKAATTYAKDAITGLKGSGGTILKTGGKAVGLAATPALEGWSAYDHHGGMYSDPTVPVMDKIGQAGRDLFHIGARTVGAGVGGAVGAGAGSVVAPVAGTVGGAVVGGGVGNYLAGKAADAVLDPANEAATAWHAKNEAAKLADAKAKAAAQTVQPTAPSGNVFDPSRTLSSSQFEPQRTGQPGIMQRGADLRGLQAAREASFGEPRGKMPPEWVRGQMTLPLGEMTGAELKSAHLAASKAYDFDAMAALKREMGHTNEMEKVSAQQKGAAADRLSKDNEAHKTRVGELIKSWAGDTKAPDYNEKVAKLHAYAANFPRNVDERTGQLVDSDTHIQSLMLNKQYDDLVAGKLGTHLLTSEKDSNDHPFVPVAEANTGLEKWAHLALGSDTRYRDMNGSNMTIYSADEKDMPGNIRAIHAERVKKGRERTATLAAAAR